jgi:hypothetical protein
VRSNPWRLVPVAPSKTTTRSFTRSRKRLIGIPRGYRPDLLGP